MSNQFVWASSEKGWMVNGKIVPFSEMSNRQLKRIYRLVQYKEQQYMNKSFVMNDKGGEIRDEADSRGISLKDMNSDYHQKSAKLRGKD